MNKVLCLLVLLIFVNSAGLAFSVRPIVRFTVGIDRDKQSFHVRVEAGRVFGDSVTLKMPAWTPGYYQLLHFADQVSGFSVTTRGKAVSFRKSARNGWTFPVSEEFVVEYDVKATRSFVAVPFVGADRAYLVPTGVLMHIAGGMGLPANVEISLPSGWTGATGLEPNGNVKNKFYAPNFDVLYDSPILFGALEELPSFEVMGVTHRFVGYNLGDFDKVKFMIDLQKIVEASVAVIGKIPYRQYTFLAIGPGPGGIEHLNSTTFGFSGESLKTEAGWKRMMTFLAHEYFHHYNVKRIRPIELGPFDYDKENRTNMLWVAEGLTVYYDILLARRAGILTDEDLMAGLQGRLLGYENKPGRLYQSATQASYNTWSDGPFGRSDDEVNKTVSVYDKGAILGLLLDFNIRQVTANKKSLDDVMRTLYKEFYIRKKRGYTEAEFQAVCERIAGVKLDEVFEYASSVKPIDYRRYFAYGGLDIDTEPKPAAGAWLGISSRTRKDSLIVTGVEYESPAWKAGVRRRMVVLSVDGKKPASVLEPQLANRRKGEKVLLQLFEGAEKEMAIELGEKVEPSFKIDRMPNPTALQRKIFENWIK
jgi:predicted metalloprotease with PDZ domain